MTVEQAVLERLLAIAGVTAIVASRVFLGALPQSARYPATRVQLIDDPRDQHLRGLNGIATARVQIDHYAYEGEDDDPYGTTATLADATIGDGFGGPSASGLAGWQGEFGDPPVRLLNAVPVDRRQDRDPELVRVITMRQDFLVTYRA